MLDIIIDFFYYYIQPETLRDLADFVQIQLSYFKEAQELFSGLVPELEQLSVEQEKLYRSSGQE